MAREPCPDGQQTQRHVGSRRVVTGTMLVLAVAVVTVLWGVENAIFPTDQTVLVAAIVVAVVTASQRFGPTVEVGGETITVSAVELAIIVGCALLEPRICLVAVAAGELLWVVVRRRWSILDILTASYGVLLAGVTIGAARAVLSLPGVGEGPATSWVALSVATIALAVFGTISAAVVDRALTGHRAWTTMAPVLYVAVMVTSVGGGAVGLGVAAVIDLAPGALLLVGPLLLAISLISGRLVSVKADLHRVSLNRQFLQALNRTSSHSPLDEALDELRELLNVSFLVLLGDDATVRAIATSDLVDARDLDGLVAMAPVRIALEHQGQPLGALLIGAKLTGAELTDLEVEIAESNAGQLATWLAKWRLNDRVEYLARHDDHTGLLNRSGLDAQILESARQARVGSVMLLDLDNFRQLNDTLGHDAGDELLLVVAQRIAAVLPPDAALARLGGDEFAAWLPGVELEEMVAVAGDVLDAINQPCEIHGLPLHVEGSIGVASYPEHGRTPNELIRRADVAMYIAKDGSLGVTRYDPALDPHSAERLRVLGELREALNDGSLLVHYQPKYELATGRVVGVESLVRWQRSDGEMVPPGRFIDAAERSGLIGPIFELVLRNSLHQIRSWARQGFDITASVNMSARNLTDPQVISVIERALVEYGVPAHKLTIELTERDLPANSAAAAALLRYLTGLGVGVSLDDFGTGQQSYVHLTQLPIDEIKIDRTFVSKISTSPLNQGIVESLVHVARRGQLHAVAEGIEDATTLELLKDMGCQFGQGYHLCRPGPADVITQVLAKNVALLTAP